jgi:hypothetical protein
MTKNCPRILACYFELLKIGNPRRKLSETIGNSRNIATVIDIETCGNLRKFLGCFFLIFSPTEKGKLPAELQLLGLSIHGVHAFADKNEVQV